MTMRKLTRRFEGKVYDYAGAHKTKKIAEERKETLKKKNYLVRVVKIAKGYAIWIRFKR